MRRKSHRPEEIKGIVNKVIVKIEKQGSGKKEKILNAWQKIVGEKAAGHSRPVGIRRNILTIEVDSSTWFYALNLKKNGILRDVKEEISDDKLKDIRFRMGDIT